MTARKNIYFLRSSSETEYEIGQRKDGKCYLMYRYQDRVHSTAVTHIPLRCCWAIHLYQVARTELPSGGARIPKQHCPAVRFSEEDTLPL